MTTTLTTQENQELLSRTTESFKHVKNSILEAMFNLQEVAEKGAWKGVYDSWGDFVEQGLGISQGFSSKLLTTYQHYILTGGVSPEKLQGIDYEKLYMARKLPVSVEEQVESARTLSRNDLKLAKIDEEPCEHPTQVLICADCHIRL